MLPITVHPSKMKILVQGDGPATKNRIAFLEGAECAFTHEPTEALREAKYDVVFAADFDQPTSENIYVHYKNQGAFVNVEDKTALCDFHVPALVRRGDLLLTISTGGKSPRVARRLRMMLENLFPAHWAEKLSELGKARDGWKQDGASFAELAEKSDAWLDESGLLKTNCACVQASTKEAA